MINNIINILKLFIPLFGFIIILLEDKRKPQSSNKLILMLFSLFFLKEVAIQIICLKFGTLLFTTYLPFYYIMSFIPMFFLLFVVTKFIAEEKKNELIICISSIIIIFTLCIIYFVQAEKYIMYPYLMLFIRILTSATMVFIIFKLNTVYFGDETNLVSKNRILINITLIIFCVHYILYFAANNPLKNIIELILFIMLAYIFYSRISEGYDENNITIDHLEYEREIFLNLLHKVGKGLTAEANFDTILELILNYSIEVLKSKAAALLLVSPNQKYLTVKYVYGLYPPTEKVEGYAATKEKFLSEKFKSEKIEIGQTYLGRVAQSGKPLLLEDVSKDPNILQTAKGLMDIHTLIVVPLKFKDEVIGIASFCNKEEGGPFTRNEFALAQTLSEQAAITLNNFRLYNELLSKQRDERELEIAGDIQTNLLPKKLPEIPELDLYAYNKPAKGVGGDYYDMINFHNQSVAVVMADVAGKGVPAALVMVMIRTILHNILKPNLKPSSIINYLNKFLTKESTKDRYATMFYFLLNMKNKRLIYTNAAHGPALLYKNSQKKFKMLDTPGLPVGIVDDQKYEQGDIVLDKGDIVMLYTDGITEAMNEKRDQFTLERIQDIIKENADKSAKEIGNIIQTKINEFTGEAPQHDDQTFILLKSQ